MLMTVRSWVKSNLEVYRNRHVGKFNWERLKKYVSIKKSNEKIKLITLSIVLILNTVILR